MISERTAILQAEIALWELRMAVKRLAELRQWRRMPPWNPLPNREPKWASTTTTNW